LVEFATRDDLRSFAATKTLVEQAELKRSWSDNTNTSGSTFLSHSSKDQELVAGASLVLTNHGAKVYVDEIDPEMPPYTSSKTADLLKSRIRQTRRFVLLASKNSKESKWVPWELGIADGYKGTSKIALFPASDTAQDMTWASWEYLGLYDRIVWGTIKGQATSGWLVLDRERFTASPLRTWLSGA
jgi:hypothetical protein